MLKQLRQQVIEKLWEDYHTSSSHIKRLEEKLLARNIQTPVLDHFAVIDLPGPHTGIPELSRIFAAIGYEFQGQDYLPEKQNGFLWMAECDSSGTEAGKVLPQVVTADFRLDEMPPTICDIVLKYSRQASPSPAAHVEQLAERASRHDAAASSELYTVIRRYLAGREWLLPTVKEFETIREFNELIAWVLVFGRRPNHFTYSIHLLSAFQNLADFHYFVEHEAGLPLNHDGGIIKGGKHTRIEQGSTAGTPETIQLADGTVELPMGFVEFVWRFAEKENPHFWEDYFTGFVANHANRVIQSLYVHDGMF